DAPFPLLHIRKLVPQRRHALTGQGFRQRLEKRMPHAGASAVREDVQTERVGRAAEDHLSFPARRARAPCRSGLSSSTGTRGSSRSFFIRAGAVASVNLRGSSLRFTSLQRSGMETVAPATGRALNGPAMVFPCPFCR